MGKIELVELEELRERGASIYVPAGVIGDALLNGKVAVVEVADREEFYEFKSRVRKYLKRKGVELSRLKHFKIEERAGAIKYALALQETIEKLILSGD